MRVKLTRVVGGDSMRDDSVEGDAVYPPMVGRPFQMTAPSRDPAYDGRFITTSPVVAIRAGGAFTTETGSRYKVELLDLGALRFFKEKTDG